ncbi:hypothetical protein BGZ63DRAFT_394382, partial [Mariannaea sp. PMI_226]
MSSSNTLSASYSCPTSAPFSISHSVSAPQSNPPSVAEKTTYLASLRAVVTDTQAQINKELTARMEEDKARDSSSKNGAIDDAKEEENYGEEVQGD